MTETTTIEISRGNWRWLNSQKNPGESFDDVLTRLRIDGDRVITPTRRDDIVAAQLDVPGSGQRAKARRQAIQRMYGYLEKHGEATKDELLDLVDPDEVEYANRESFWANCVKGKPTLSRLAGVESPGSGGSVWRFVDDD